MRPEGHAEPLGVVNHGMTTLSRSVLGLVLLAMALVIGVLAAAAVAFAMNAVLPPFRREDDDTLREFIPVAITYTTMAGTTALVAYVAWRRLRAPSSLGPRDTDRP
jgi:hypothetical protein